MGNKPKKALFLDRDGVINKDYGYVYQVVDAIFMPGIFELARAAHQKGYLLIVVTNQSGIGRGFYTEEAFLDLMDWMKEQFAEEGAPLTDVYYSPYHADAGIGKYKKFSEDYKPQPGMLLKAISKYGIDPLQSLIIGDKHKDMQAGKAAGVPTRILFTQEDFACPEATARITDLKDALRYL